MAKVFAFRTVKPNIVGRFDSEAIPQGFEILTDEDKINEQYCKLYRKREDDGIDYYAQFRVSLVRSIEDATYTAAEVFTLEAHIKDLADMFRTGNWLTAQSHNSSLALSGIYDQAMKDQLQADIDAYVSANY